jgi:hypothetical protein
MDSETDSALDLERIQQPFRRIQHQILKPFKTDSASIQNYYSISSELLQHQFQNGFSINFRTDSASNSERIQHPFSTDSASL